MSPSSRAWHAALRSVLATALLLAAAGARAQAAADGDAPTDLLTQTDADVEAKSRGCITCHSGVEPMHQLRAVKLGCVDCHGGDATATVREKAHVRARYPDRWRTSANPERSYTLLNEESPEFVRFVNPGDLRAADAACGACHSTIVRNVKKSMMTTSSLLWGGAAYNNGIVSSKTYFFGESYSRDGVPQRINQVPPPGPEELARGVLPVLLPLPRWEISQVTDMFRTFERGGRLSRANPSEIGTPDPFEEPGRPDMKVSARGLGTELRISSPVLNIHKTRLNDPHLSFLGTNDHPGDYRSSGCTSCHVIYANDRSPIHSGPYAAFGNRGRTQTADTTIAREESGHPLRHQFTSAIPSSQCMVCHMHQPNAFMNTFYGYQMWDYETDGELLYPQEQARPTDDQAFAMLSRNPEEAVLRGKWSDPEFLAEVSGLNPGLSATQFSDYHGHGWIFKAVFKKDRQGNLLDESGEPIDPSDPHKFHGVVPLEGQADACADPGCREARKAVHLKDIHAERGMHCVDCHFARDAHGDGNLYGEFHNAVEIRCEDCHGTAQQRATLRTSGSSAPPGGTDLTALFTPFEPKKQRFRLIDGKVVQRSMIDPGREWEVPQVIDTVDPASPAYNEKARRAKLVCQGGRMLEPGMDPALLAHSNEKMECYSCHTSWVTNCFGCHLPQQANWKKSASHFEGETSRNWTTYNPQVLREDGFMLGLHGTSKGGKVAPVRSSSALVLSSRNANREQIYNQQAPISAPGYSSQAFNPHFPHTVRTAETRTCTDCHLSTANDNNAWMAQVLLQGTNLVNFMGKYAWVGLAEHGLQAVKVTEDGEPQAVIGSYLHELAYPGDCRDHRARGGQLSVAHHHGGADVRSLQLRGEYLYTANGPDGLRVYDVANVDNKGFSERIVSAPVSPAGQDTRVDTEYATAVALPTNMPIDTRRTHRPENQEQWPIHPLYSYAFVTDREEGLILVDVMNLVDGDPTNNFLKRAVTFNPSGALRGAMNLAIAGTHVFVCCDAGLVVVSVDRPEEPRIVATIDDAFVKRPTSVAVQFRYAFVTDGEGLKVIDVTDPERPRAIPSGFVPLHRANDVYVARTYAYVAGGEDGVVIVDVKNPEAPFVDQQFTAGGQIDDARSVRVASTDASVFAYVADGANGLRVVQLTSPVTPGYNGFSPRPVPELIATFRTHGEAIALSKGMDRDRAVDESGNQVSVFGRLGSRPFTLAEQQKLYLRDGKVWTVSDLAPPVEVGRADRAP